MISSPIFGSFFGDMLGIGTFDEPPDSVPLRILGLAELPADESALRLAFVRKVRELHPDLNPLDDTSWAEVHGDEWAEIQWARSVILRKMTSVTASAVPTGPLGNRNGPGIDWCRTCERPFGIFNAGGVPAASSWPNRWWREGLCERCAHEVDLQRARERRRRARADRRCASCTGTFTPSRSDGRYCSSKCRQRAYRLRSRS